MRAWLVMSAVAVVFAGSIEAVEARGRGFGRLFSGRAPTPYRPIASSPAAGLRPEATQATKLSYQPAIAITPGRTTAVAAATAVPVAAATELRLSDEPVAAPLRSVPSSVAPPPQQVREARAVLPPCAPERLVGGLGETMSGFCLIN